MILNILLIGVLAYLAYLKFREIEKNELDIERYSRRFVVFATMIHLVKREDDTVDGYSEEIRKLIGEAEPEDGIKEIATRTIVDLNEVEQIFEWTSGSYESDKIQNDCCRLYFRGGGYLTVFEPFEVVEDALVAYRYG